MAGCEYNVESIVEKANDLLVARRQKLAGMSCRERVPTRYAHLPPYSMMGNGTDIGAVSQVMA